MEYIRHASTQDIAAIGAALSVAGLTWRYLTKPTSKFPLPPGPKPLPILGNLLDLPTSQEWRTYDKWSQTYGDVIFVEALGQRIVVLNSPQAASDLLERRSAIYSDRPETVMIHELMNWGWTLGFVLYGDEWRLERRLLHEQVHINVVPQYQGIQLRSARKFLKVLAEDPSDISALVRNLFGDTIMDAAYGIETAPKNDRYIAIAEEALGLLSQASLPGAYLVDLIRPLKYVPSWFPGAGFKRTAALARRRNQEMLDKPLKVVQDAMAAGTAKRSMASQLLDNVPEGKLDARMENAIKHTAGNAYVAGSDTTVSAVTCLFLAMAKYPSVLAKAQEELDSVVGHDRLPDFSDKSDLPYIHAMVLELLRWQPVLPLGVPHKSTADDEYRGYLIPKGTVVIANNWGIMHNPEVYPEPEEFKPERFLKMTTDGKYEIDKSVPDPREAAFGWGRRICPGMHFAEQSLYSLTANLLAAFNITAPLDAAGKPKYPKIEMCSGLLSHPLHFDCVIKPRSKHAEELISQPLPERGL